MREIKLRAEYIMVAEKRALKKEMLLLKGAALGIIICLGVFIVSFTSGEIYFYGFYFGRKILMIPCIFGISVLSWFYFSERLYFTGRLFYLSGESTEDPSFFVRFGTVLRYALFVIWEKTVSFMWLNFFLLPSRFVGIIIIRTFSETGNMQRVMLITLVSAFALLSAVGLAFYFYLSGRYFLSELLFIRCPKQNVFEILKNSSLLTRDSLTRIMLFKIGRLFGKRGITGKMRRALYASDLFSDRKFYRNYGLIKPVTYPEPS